jgi:hypothetical protein
MFIKSRRKYVVLCIRVYNVHNMRIGYGWSDDDDNNEQQVDDEKRDNMDEEEIQDLKLMKEYADVVVDNKDVGFEAGPRPFPLPRIYSERRGMMTLLQTNVPQIPDVVLSIVVDYADLGPVRLMPVQQPLRAWGSIYGGMNGFFPEPISDRGEDVGMKQLFTTKHDIRCEVRWVPVPYFIYTITNDAVMTKRSGLGSLSCTGEWIWTPQLTWLLDEEMPSFDLASRYEKMKLIERAWIYSCCVLGTVPIPTTPVGQRPAVSDNDRPKQKRRRRRRHRRQ